MPDRFVDVHFDRVLASPVETLREAYGRMGRDFGQEHAERVLAYLRDKPRGKYGVHKYAPEDWGFEAAFAPRAPRARTSITSAYRSSRSARRAPCPRPTSRSAGSARPPAASRVDVADNRVVDIRPDPEHVVSRGYACVKGTRYAAMQHSPDRVVAPQKRVGDRWETAGWDAALRDDRGEGARGDRAERPATPSATSPARRRGANVLSPIFRGALWKAMGSTRMYGTGTCDTMNKFRVNEDMYGSPMRLAHPDVDRTSFLLVIGANPAVSGNTLYHLPRSRERFAEMVERGGRVVFLNPRRVETARAGEHVFIRPDTDLFFLAAFLRERIALGPLDRARIERTMTGFAELERAVAAWTPERQAAVTGVPAETLRELARAHAAADGAALYMATGVNQGRSGTTCFWLLECINAVSGNLDRKGGTLMGRGLFDMAAEVVKDPQMMVHHDRGDAFPTVSGQQPAGLLADDIESGRVTVLFVEASNPLLACPNPSRPPRPRARQARAPRLDRSLPQRGRQPRALRAAGDDVARAAGDPVRAPELRGLHADAVHHLRRRDPRAAARRAPRVVDVRAPRGRAGRHALRQPAREHRGEARRAAPPHPARPARSTSRTASSTGCCGRAASRPARR